MPHPKAKSDHSQAPLGVASAASAFLIWGLSPIYWKALAKVPAFEILMHRMVWSFLFLIPIVALSGRWGAFKSAIRNKKTILILLGTTTIVGGNWFLFIWAINSNHVLQTSLGYFMNPLLMVLLGVLFLRERLRRAQWLAVGLAAAGVLYLTIGYGQFPWVAMALAVSFGLYGLIREVAAVGSLVGLTVETLLLGIPATAYLFPLEHAGTGAFGHGAARISWLLAGAALLTGLPLLLFTTGARLLRYSTVGFLQYIAPSCTFLLAVLVYNEPLTRSHLVTFGCIWTGLIIFSIDSIMVGRRTAGHGGLAR